MSLIDLELDQYLFQSHTMRFAVRADDPKADDLIEDAKVVYKAQDFFITEVFDDHSSDGVALKRIEAEVWWMRLADRKRPGNFVLVDATPEAGLTSILSTTDVTIGQVTEDTGVYQLESTDSTVLDLIWQWAKITGNEVEFDATQKVVHFIPQVGANRGMSFRWGRNLTSIQRKSQPPKVTRLYAFGRDGLSIEALASGRQYIEDFSYYTDQGITLEEARANYTKEETYTDDSFLDDVSLYNFAVIRLAQLSQPVVTYTATALDLSSVIGVNDGAYNPGDIVMVYDSILGINVLARVSRRVRFPDSPDKDRVELAFNGVAIPDPRASAGRESSTKSWELFESRNWTTERRIRQISNIVNKLILRHIENAEWIVNYKIQADMIGTGTATLRIYDAVTDLDLWIPQTIDIVDGGRYDFEMSFGEKELPAGTSQITVSIISDDVSCGLNIPEGQTALWVLARGTTRTSLSFPNSIRYDFLGLTGNANIQYFQVPEFVYEIQVQCVSSGTTQYGGSGGAITATIAVTPLEWFDVYAPQKGQNGDLTAPSGGTWPNAGSGTRPGSAPDRGAGGGASASIRRQGTTFADSLIVTPAGGGAGYGQAVTYGKYGGDGRFLEGEDGQTFRFGGGATQYSGGVGSGEVDISGNPNHGSFSQGGNGAHTTSSFAFGGGGGGGGWYGGAGAAQPGSPGGYAGGGGGGGGGTGWVGDVYDVEIEDGFVTANEDGYVIISWKDPDESLAPY